MLGRRTSRQGWRGGWHTSSRRRIPGQVGGTQRWSIKKTNPWAVVGRWVAKRWVGGTCLDSTCLDIPVVFPAEVGASHVSGNFFRHASASLLPWVGRDSDRDGGLAACPDCPVLLKREFVPPTQHRPTREVTPTLRTHLRGISFKWWASGELGSPRRRHGGNHSAGF